jgi:hypothetical protein
MAGSCGRVQQNSILNGKTIMQEGSAKLSKAKQNEGT